MTVTGSIAWDGVPGDWWGTVVFTLANRSSVAVVDPLIQFTVESRQSIARNSGYTPERPAGSNRVSGRLDAWRDSIPAGGEVSFTLGVGPADSQPGVGSLPTRLTVNGQPVDGGGPPPDERPAAPGRLRVTGTSAGSVSLAWDPPASQAGIGGYVLTWAGGGSGDARLGGAAVGHTVPGLAANTSYRFSLFAVDQAGREGHPATVEARTDSDITPPPPPPPPPPVGGWPASAPFVDATAWPTPRLGKIVAGSGVAGLFLGFLAGRVVDGRTRATWGGLASSYDKYEPAGDDQCRPGPGDGRTHSSVAAESSYLKWLTGPFQASGGKVVISVGGASAHPIEEAADVTAEQAAAEYLSVLDNYCTTLLDFDIEGSALGAPAHQVKHAAVLAAIRRMRPDVRISHTLPVDRDGWNPTTRAVMRTIADSGYRPDLLVGMLMEMRGPEDYWQVTRMSAESMVGHARDYFGFGEQEAWARFGACPMFGQNINRRVFTAGHMRQLVAFAQERGMGVVSGWDASRDYNQGNPDRGCEDTPTCPETVGDGALNTCTRVPQQHLEFCQIAATYRRQ